jgi:hypothetical protein
MLTVMILGAYIELPVMLNILLHYRPTTPISDRLSWYYDKSIGVPLQYASAHSSIVRAFYAPQFRLTEWIGRRLSPVKSRGEKQQSMNERAQLPRRIAWFAPNP